MEIKKEVMEINLEDEMDKIEVVTEVGNRIILHVPLINSIAKLAKLAKVVQQFKIQMDLLCNGDVLVT